MYHVRCITALTICLITIFASLTCVVQAQQAPGQDQEYTSQQIKSISAQVFLERMEKPEPGYHKFAALWALSRKAKEADTATRWPILELVNNAMYDKSRSVYQRFQCCYVISDCGDDRWAPQLVPVLLRDPSNTMRSVAAEALGKFKGCAAARDALTKASKQEKDPLVIEAINRSLFQGDAKYTPEQIKSITAQEFLQKMENTEPGYHKYAAMWALTQKAQQSDLVARKDIMTLVVVAMNNKSRSDVGRWECCYVISDCGDDMWVPPLIDVLTRDPAFIMREVAAEALGKFAGCAAAHDALLDAQQKEIDKRVLDVIDRILKNKVGASL
jgi:HEAT repeat protein